MGDSVIRYGALNRQIHRRIRRERGDSKFDGHTCGRNPSQYRSRISMVDSLWTRYFAGKPGTPESVELLRQIRECGVGK